MGSNAKRVGTRKIYFGVSFSNSIHKENLMRTHIIIDDTLMSDALKATGIKSKREVVELGLKTLLMLKQQESIKAFKGNTNGRAIWSK